MKTKSILTTLALILFVSVSTLAQSNVKVIAIINKAEWCPTCQNNGSRAMAALMANNKDGAIAFIANDLTNDETKKASIESLKPYGLDSKVSELNGTGTVFFFNAETKALINQISVSKSDEELAKAVVTAEKGL